MTSPVYLPPVVPAPRDLQGFRAWLPNQLQVYISTPCDDGHKLCYWQSLLALANSRSQHHFRLQAVPGDSLVSRIRNRIAHDFYFNTADDYLFTIDSDTDYTPQDVVQTVERRVPIIAGCYAIKQEELRWCLNELDGEQIDPVTKLKKIALAGTGWLCIHRSVIGRMINAAATWRKWRMDFIDDSTHARSFDLYHVGVVDDPKWFSHSPRYLSEDWGICYLARKLGYDIWLDTECVVLHRGETFYPRAQGNIPHRAPAPRTAPQGLFLPV